jgi:hypothetical protein
MFIHFDSSDGEQCDNCGTPHTIMHMSTGHRDRSINLCLGCLAHWPRCSVTLRKNSDSEETRKAPY